MMNVSEEADETATSRRISAPINPAASARPTPIITTRMIATAAKLRKLSTNDVNRKRTPSTVSRLRTSLVFSRTSYSAAGSDSFGPT